MTPGVPAPPRDLSFRKLPIESLEPRVRLIRLHRRNHDPLFFGPARGTPPRGRWDAADGSYGVCYLARWESRWVAFAERLLHDPGLRLVGREELAALSVARIEVTEELHLVAFHGPGLARLSTSAAVSNGAYEDGRPWAAALHSHPEPPDGIAWRSRVDNEGIAIALFDRAAHKVRDVARRGLLDHRNARYLRECVERYEVALA